MNELYHNHLHSSTSFKTQKSSFMQLNLYRFHLNTNLWLGQVRWTVCRIMFNITHWPSLYQIHRLYRGGGGSLQRAQEEWSTGVWKSAPVREAGFNAIAETGPSLPQYPASVPSYPENRPW